MAYTINKSDGTVLTTIADSQLDTSTNLGLPGPNYVGYGRTLNENLVYLLENFAGNSAPLSNNLQGQLWFDKSHQTLKVFTDQGYLSVAGATISGTEPAFAKEGDTWFNSTANQFYVYDGTKFNIVGPGYTKAQGISGAVPIAVSDANSSGITHNILKLQFGNTVIATVSSDPAFTTGTPISGFSTIYPGITYNSTIGADTVANTRVAAYLPLDNTIISLQTGGMLANTAIVTANISMQGYVDDQIITANTAVVGYITAVNAVMIANVVAATTAIVTANTAMKAYVDTVTTLWTANASAQESAISGLRSNIIAANTAIITANTGLKIYTDSQIVAANSAVVGYVNSLNSSTQANVIAANAAIITANVGMKGYVDYGNLQVNNQLQTINTSLIGISNGQTAANTSIVTANTRMKSYVDTHISTLYNPMVLANYTKLQLSAATPGAGAIAYCTNVTGGAKVVYYDGADWRTISGSVFVANISAVAP